MGYDFEIEYKVGSENKVADGLSRIVQPKENALSTLLWSLTVPRTLQLQDLLTEVENSVEVQRLKQRVLSGEKVKEGMEVRQGKLLLRGRLVLPKDSPSIPLILKEYHDSLMGRHSGVLKTLRRIQESFYWPKMRQSIHDYVAACVVCQTHKYSTLSPAGLLQPIEIPTRV